MCVGACVWEGGVRGWGLGTVSGSMYTVDQWQTFLSRKHTWVRQIVTLLNISLVRSDTHIFSVHFITIFSSSFGTFTYMKPNRAHTLSQLAGAIPAISAPKWICQNHAVIACLSNLALYSIPDSGLKKKKPFSVGYRLLPFFWIPSVHYFWGVPLSQVRIWCFWCRSNIASRILNIMKE